MQNRNKGITLIALVITIIVLLILAGVTLNLTLGENGLLKRAEEAKIKYNEQEAREKLEMALMGLQADKRTKKEEYNKNEYVDNKLNEEDMEVLGDVVTVDEWQFKIDRDNLKIEESIGKLTEEAKLLPTITKLNIEKIKNNVIISIKLRNEENAKITYTIKKEGETTDLEKAENQTTLEYTFSNLDLGKYIISIHTENEHGTDDITKTIEIIVNIDFTATNKEMWIGESKDIEYTITPENVSNENLKWTSSNPSILEIDENGKLTAIKEGTAIITATLDGINSSCTIEVKKNLFEDIAQSGKTIEELGMNITKGYLGYFTFDPSDKKGIFGGSGSGIHNWSWNFIVPGDIFKERGVNSITSVWDLYIENERGYISTCIAEMEIMYEDGETQSVKSDFSVPGYTSKSSEYRLNHTFKDKAVKTVTFKAYGYDADFSGSNARLKSIIY